MAIAAPGGVPPREALEELIGDARIVLIGESSHGTHEFYEARAAITKWLIEEKGFCAVAAEADWPDAYRVNRYVRGLGEDESADAALSGFERFPAWMWRNTVVRDFVDWLRIRNRQHESNGQRQAGFYGLDLYSLHRSMDEVIDYLDKVDPKAAARARERYACFDHASADDGQAYGFAAAFGAGPSCEDQAIEQLVDLQRNALAYARRDGLIAEDELFYAERNAQTVRNAEVYYRAMFSGRVNSWNLRDKHMAQTLDALLKHLDRHADVPSARIVVWAHNSHVGDARATEVGVRRAAHAWSTCSSAIWRSGASHRVQHLLGHGHRRQRLGRCCRTKGRSPCPQWKHRRAAARDRPECISGVARPSAPKPQSRSVRCGWDAPSA